MTRIQWVNLDNDKKYQEKKGMPKLREMGREIFFKAEFDNKDIFSIVTFSIKQNGNNAKYELKEQSLSGPAHRRLGNRIAVNGVAFIRVKVSAAGGDKYKLSAWDIKNTEVIHEEYETKRKIYYCVIDMKSIDGLADYGFLESTFKKNKREILLKQLDSLDTSEHSYNFGYEQSEYDRIFNMAKPCYNMEKDPYSFAIAYVDCLADGPHETEEYAYVVSKTDGIITVPITGRSNQLWYNIDKSAGAKDWNRLVAFIYEEHGVENVFPIPDGDITPDYKNIKINTRNFPEAVIGYVKAKIFIASRFIGGLSFPDANITVVATRGQDDKKFNEIEKKNIIIHEAGHKLGMVPNGSDDLVEQDTLDKTHDTADTKKHCSNIRCTMWWTMRDSITFCGSCDKSLRRLDLTASKLDGFKNRFF